MKFLAANISMYVMTAKISTLLSPSWKASYAFSGFKSCILCRNKLTTAKPPQQPREHNGALAPFFSPYVVAFRFGFEM